MLSILLILLSVFSRLIPHIPNFVSIGAVSLFGGVYMKKRYFFIPIVAMLISDYFIGLYDWKLMVSVYGSYVLCFFIGSLLKKFQKINVALFGSLGCSIAFFLITNFGVWAFANWYPHNLTGLIQCFTAAIPFFRNSIMGDMFYSVVLIGSFETVKNLWKSRYTIAVAS